MFALAVLHPVANLGWWRWSIHPSIVIGVAALGALYIWASHRLRRPPTDGQKILFVSGLLLMFATLNGPLHDLSDDYLFSAHMVQHLLLTLAIPPLLLAGTPGWMLRPLLSRRGIRPVAQFFTRAQIAFVVFNVTIALWHLPPFFNTAIEHPCLHIHVHLMLFATAGLNGWPLLSRLPE